MEVDASTREAFKASLGMSDQEVDAMIRTSEEISHDIDKRANGAPCVLLCRGERYAEVIRKEGDEVTLAFHNQYTTGSAAEMERDGWKAAAALRIQKANGSLAYAIKTEGGTDWYIAGKYSPAVRRKK